MELKEFILKGPDTKSIRKWIWNLYKWGKIIQVKAAYAFALNCLPI
ncbi:MAG: hypothetical protein KAI83_00390 [Thiomargarita sp.]|nr:hypothetical protein [Thiomargarita sp.]